MVASAKITPASRRRSRRSRDPAERVLLGAVVFLVCLGLVMVYSVSSAQAVIAGRNPSGQVQRQAMYALIGFVVFAVVANARPHQLRRLAPMAVGTSIVLLLGVLVLPTGGLPAHSVYVNGAKRWLALGPLQLQPSELAKLALVLWIAMAVARDPRAITRPGGLRPYAILTGLLAALIVVEPDLGTTGTLVICALTMVFVAGAPIKSLGTILAGVAALLVLMLALFPYQRARLVSFVNPWADPTGAGFQAVQAQIAIGSGGLFGRGLGEGLQSNNFLPEAHTDFIAAIVGEELGLIGLFAIIAAFVAIGICGYRIAIRAKDVHGRLLATGTTSLLCAQAGINLGQVFGVLPVTGVPLPFVSAGGTSVVVFLAGVGVLVNISRGGRRAATRTAGGTAAPRRDRGSGNGRARQAGAGNRRRLAS